MATRLKVRLSEYVDLQGPLLLGSEATPRELPEGPTQRASVLGM